MCFCAFSLCEPVPTSLENALEPRLADQRKALHRLSKFDEFGIGAEPLMVVPLAVADGTCAGAAGAGGCASPEAAAVLTLGAGDRDGAA